MGEGLLNSTEAGVTQQLRRQKTQQGDGSQKLQPWSSRHNTQAADRSAISPLCSWAAQSSPTAALFLIPSGKLGRGLSESCKIPFSQKVAVCLPPRSPEGPPPWRESLGPEESATQHQPFPASLLHPLCSPLLVRLAGCFVWL